MNTRASILKKYSVSSDVPIGRGMEAEVFARGDDSVLKLYAGTGTYADLVALKDFYRSLDRSLVPYELPNIHLVAQEQGYVVTVEQRLTGRSLATLLPHLNNQQLDAAMQEYSSAVVALSHINAHDEQTQLKLFDPQQLSQTAPRNWHRFLLNYLNHKLAQLSPYLKRDVEQFSAKWAQLSNILNAPYTGAYKLIHGDFCPGNLLVDAQYRASALIDFGLFTMFGDPLFDVATSWLFFDMYAELKANIYERLLAILLDQVGNDKRAILYRYILIYSILSANTYSAGCTDGHYQWCVANLNNQLYWEVIS